MDLKTLNKTFYEINEIVCSCRYLDWDTVKINAFWLAHAQEDKHFHLLDIQLQDKYVQQARQR